MINLNNNNNKDKLFYNKEELIKNFNKKENGINIKNYYCEEENAKYKPIFLLTIIGYYIVLFIIELAIYSWIPLIMMIMTFIIIWIYGLISIIKNDFKKDNEKIVWILLIIFIPLSAILYPDFERTQTIKK